jgi:hypothetical protein
MKQLMVVAVVVMSNCASPRSRGLAEPQPPVTVPGLRRDCLALEAKAEWTSAATQGLVYASGGTGLAAIFAGREMTPAQQTALGLAGLTAGIGAAVLSTMNAHANAGVLQCRQDAADAKLEATKAQLDAALAEPR